MAVKDDLVFIGVGAVVLIGAAWYIKNKVADAAGAVGDAVVAAVPYVNPADPKNVINQGATSLYQSVTGSTGSIGGDIYDFFHSSGP